MILLKPGNRILEETVQGAVEKYLDNKSAEKPKPFQMLVHLCDFDDASYVVEVQRDTPNILKIQMALPSFAATADHGAGAALDAEFGAMLVEADAKHDVALQIDMDDVQDIAATAKKVSMFKPVAMGGPFEHLFDSCIAGTPADPLAYAMRDDTHVYCHTGSDRVTVVFELTFTDKVDTAIAKIFLQEFQEGTRHVRGTTPCTFSQTPPAELAKFGVTEPKPGCLGYLSFSVLQDLLKKKTAVHVARTLQSFRNYLQYHLKCSKAHFHSRMRARVFSLQQVLNRARMPEEDQQKKKKTFSGKTFSRK
jgi:actin related protein 2/3 complex, subunit 2